MQKKFSIIGSTGSIGTQTLDIVAEQGERFEVVALAAGGNVELLAQQLREFPTVSLVSVRDEAGAAQLRELIKGLPQVVDSFRGGGEEGKGTGSRGRGSTWQFDSTLPLPVFFAVCVVPLV